MDYLDTLDKTAQALYVLNVVYGNMLPDGMEDKIDQLMNLIDKELKERNYIKAKYV